MKYHHTIVIALSTVATLQACKTVSRDGFAPKVSDVSIRLPEAYALHEARAIFTRTDVPSDPLQIKGTDLSIKLPSGTYSLDLVVLNNKGIEELKSCDKSKPFVFKQSSETAVVDLCQVTDTSVVVTTLPPLDPTVIVDPVPPLTTPPQIIPVPTVPKFTMNDTCFGLASTASVEGNEVVIKLSDTITDKVMDNTSYLRCKLTFNVAKAKGMIYAPLVFRVAYESDDKSLKQNLWLMADGRDDTNALALPCDGFLFNTNANSRKAFVCSFYNTVAEHMGEIFPRTKPQYDASCATETSQMIYTLTLAGPNKSWISSLKIPEVRVQIPQPEKCAS